MHVRRCQAISLDEAVMGRCIPNPVMPCMSCKQMRPGMHLYLQDDWQGPLLWELPACHAICEKLSIYLCKVTHQPGQLATRYCHVMSCHVMSCVKQMQQARSDSLRTVSQQTASHVPSLSAASGLILSAWQTCSTTCSTSSIIKPADLQSIMQHQQFHQHDGPGRHTLKLPPASCFILARTAVSTSSDVYCLWGVSCMAGTCPAATAAR